MNNRSLSREADNAKSNIEGVINNLISEIEDLEEEVSKLKSDIEDHESYRDSLQDRITELEDDFQFTKDELESHLD